ncbi:MAG: response regulator [Desulfotomaculales bacterium]
MKNQYLILVADDEEIVREMLEDTLKEEGYRVATAKDGKEALEKIDSLAPDAVLLDNKMPEMSGVEVLEIIRRAGAVVPVILMTAYGSTEVPSRPRNSEPSTIL